MDPSSIHPSVHEAATLPFSLGGLGIRSAFRSRESDHWASWADCSAMVKARHPIVAARNRWRIGQVHTSCMPWRRAGLCSGVGRGWHRTSIARGDVQDQPRCGWQREVSLKVEQHFRDTWLLPTITEPDQALLRSQGGPLVAAPFTSCPTDKLFRIEPQCSVFCCSAVFASTPLVTTQLRVAVHSTSLATIVQLAQWQGCWVGGASPWRAWWLAYAVKEVPEWLDGRRLEVVADGLPLFGGAQLAIDATLGAAGAALSAARRRKVRTYPELSGDGGRCRLVVLGGEVAGRWSSETRQFLTALSRAKSRRRRWGNMLGCCAARAVVESLLGRKGARHPCMRWSVITDTPETDMF